MYVGDLETGAVVLFAKPKGKRGKYYPFYFQGYDKNWGTYTFTDGEGTIYFQEELKFENEEELNNIKKES